MKRPRFAVHIEELVLHGFAAADARGIAAVLQAELARELGGALPRVAGVTAIERIDAGSFPIAAPARPAAVGGRVAGTIGSALRGALGGRR